MSTTTLTVRVETGIAKRLEHLAEATRRSKSYLAAEAIEEYLAVQEWQVQAILQGAEQAEAGDGVDFDEVRRAWEQRRADPTD